MSFKLNTKNYRIPFPSIDCEEDFGQFAQALGGEVIEQDVLQLSGRLAKGVVKINQVTAGCCVRAWNLFFNQPVELYKPGIRSENKSFSIIYVLTPESCQLKSIGEHWQFSQAGIRTALMVGNDIDLQFDIQSFHPVQVIDINVSTLWLALQFQKAGFPIENLMDKLREKEEAFILSKVCSTAVIMGVNKLFDTIMNAERNPELVVQEAAALIIDFLSKSLNSNVPIVQGSNDAHFQKVMEAEIILQAHLQKNLPCVSNIAQQVSLSESTLKRHFKAIFGKSMYEYYLEKKMNLAKLLLLEQPLTVYETANLLGYEKVSNFIEIFKKHHGFSPGSMKKKGFMNL
jgi:AraC-like DNA-binding protein